MGGHGRAGARGLGQVRRGAACKAPHSACIMSCRGCLPAGLTAVHLALSHAHVLHPAPAPLLFPMYEHRTIGVSNLSAKKLERLLTKASVRPAVNQASFAVPAAVPRCCSRVGCSMVQKHRASACLAASLPDCRQRTQRASHNLCQLASLGDHPASPRLWLCRLRRTHTGGTRTFCIGARHDEGKGMVGR